MDTQVLIAYDGSESAERAIRSTATLLKSGSATVLTVWERPLGTSASLMMDPTFPVGRIDPVEEPELEAAVESRAVAMAERGAIIAADAGFAQVTARAELLDKQVSRTILAVADEIGAGAIVMGTRGLSGLKTAILGSVSHDVVQHSALPVLLVPHD
jgi:nucleotide-binding universal stress UspA family protein